IAVSLLPQCLEDVERDLREGRVLHVDTHEEPVALARVEDAAQIVDAGCAIDLETELRQLERQVALDARRNDRVHQSEIRAGRGGRLVDVAYALAHGVEG